MWESAPTIRSPNGFVDVMYTNDTEHRHHHFDLYKRVHFRYFANDKTRVGLDAEYVKELGRVSADPILVDDILAVLFDKTGLDKLIDLFALDEISAVLGHIFDEVIRNIGKGKAFLFSDTRQIVIEACAGNNVFCRFFDIGGIVYDDRRISGAGTDGFFARRKKRLDNARAAGCDKHTDDRRLHHFIGGFFGRMFDGNDQIFRAAGFENGAVDKVNGVICGFAGVRMRVKDNAVAAGNHADGVADNGFTGIGGRRDAADNAIGCHFDKRQAAIAGKGRGMQILRAGCFVGDQLMLDNLVGNAAHAGFLNAQARHIFGFGKREFADLGDHFFTLLDAVFFILFIRLIDSRKRFGHGWKHTFLRLLCGSHGFYDTGNNFAYHSFVHA